MPGARCPVPGARVVPEGSEVKKIRRAPRGINERSTGNQCEIFVKKIRRAPRGINVRSMGNQCEIFVKSM